MLTCKYSHAPIIQPGILGGLRPAADRLTDVQVFLQDPGLAKGGSLSGWPMLCLLGLFILQQMLAQHIKAAPIFRLGFSPPSTLVSRLWQPSRPYGL